MWGEHCLGFACSNAQVAGLHLTLLDFKGRKVGVFGCRMFSGLTFWGFSPLTRRSPACGMSSVKTQQPRLRVCFVGTACSCRSFRV